MPKGLYKPKQPEKYIGDPNKIRFMSSWELTFFRFLDGNPNIVRWASEEIAIPYYNPVKQRMANYYPDIYMEYIDVNGQPRKCLVEVKPAKEAVQTSSSSLHDKVAICINEQKWDAAKQFCDKHDIEFKVVTENELFVKKGKKKR